jgi:endothelin-converting enzyme
MSLDDAAALTPQVGLADLVSGLAPSGEKVDRVIVMAPKYMKALSTILSETPANVLQSYFLWKAVQSFSSYIKANEIKPYQQFQNELAGKVLPRTPYEFSGQWLTPFRIPIPSLRDGAPVSDTSTMD